MTARPKQHEGPEKLPPTENADIFALQAVAKGIANEAQQQRALNYIIVTLCAVDRWEFWPDSVRKTDLALGKRWVGVQIRRILKLKPQGIESRE